MKYIVPIYVAEAERYWLSSEGLNLMTRFCSNIMEIAKAGIVFLSDNDTVIEMASGAGIFNLIKFPRNDNSSALLPEGGVTALDFALAQGLEENVAILNYRSLSIKKSILNDLNLALETPDTECVVGVLPCRDNPCQLFIYAKVLHVEPIPETGISETDAYTVTKTTSGKEITIHWDSFGTKDIVIRIYGLSPSTQKTELLLEVTDKTCEKFKFHSEKKHLVFCALQATGGDIQYTEPFRPISNLWRLHSKLKSTALTLDGTAITGRQWVPDIFTPAGAASAVSAKLLRKGFHTLDRKKVKGFQIPQKYLPITDNMSFRLAWARSGNVH